MVVLPTLEKPVDFIQDDIMLNHFIVLGLTVIEYHNNVINNEFKGQPQNQEKSKGLIYNVFIFII